MNKNGFIRFVALCFCLCLVVISGCGGDDTMSGYGEVVKAEYPDIVQYPKDEDYCRADGSEDYIAYDEAYDKWRMDYINRVKQSEGYKEGLEDFCYTTMKEFLSEADGENKVYSPLNVYIALSMLAEVTNGNSREQILNLLGEESIEGLRDKVSNLWSANYNDDGTVTSVLANSLWLDETVEFEQAVINTLAEKYYASSYTGKMDSEEINALFHDWLNEQTRGLLKEEAEQISLDSDAIMALASTIYLKARWSDTFWEEKTHKDTFHAVSGDIECDFMYQKIRKELYCGDNFACVYKELENSGDMWLVLPNEGVTVDELLEDEAVMNMVMDSSAWQDKREVIVNLYMPKFDVSSEIDLTGELKALGVTDVFDSKMSDFSPLVKNREDIFLSQAKHAARVITNEDGCEATAFTAVVAYGAAMREPLKEIDFVLDRPFMFVITGADGTPTFAGVVNQPS